MCEKAIDKNDSFGGRQGDIAPNNEKRSRDQDREAQKISQVGHTNDRKGDAPAPGGRIACGASARSGWFDDKTKEIGDAASSSQFEFGWIYRGTEAGHRRERTAHSDSVS